MCPCPALAAVAHTGSQLKSPPRTTGKANAHLPSLPASQAACACPDKAPSYNCSPCVPMQTSGMHVASRSRLSPGPCRTRPWGRHHPSPLCNTQLLARGTLCPGSIASHIHGSRVWQLQTEAGTMVSVPVALETARGLGTWSEPEPVWLVWPGSTFLRPRAWLFPWVPSCSPALSFASASCSRASAAQTSTAGSRWQCLSTNS